MGSGQAGKMNFSRPDQIGGEPDWRAEMVIGVPENITKSGRD